MDTVSSVVATRAILLGHIRRDNPSLSEQAIHEISSQFNNNLDSYTVQRTRAYREFQKEDLIATYNRTRNRRYRAIQSVIDSIERETGLTPVQIPDTQNNQISYLYERNPFFG